jgi:hypothetical protein
MQFCRSTQRCRSGWTLWLDAYIGGLVNYNQCVIITDASAGRDDGVTYMIALHTGSIAEKDFTLLP